MFRDEYNAVPGHSNYNVHSNKNKALQLNTWGLF